ncbi:hypothetical protein BJ878DRAFT_563889 [Calycina marina]|uniref:Uncharacterized protein n=1 Tax=Calycina marina TaxID=1763456 RepID=A0A9P7ZB15_9HELO|nr:hypothetical protein BJ878DRAFT_563889 [Calycina marina]
MHLRFLTALLFAFNTRYCPATINEHDRGDIRLMVCVSMLLIGGLSIHLDSWDVNKRTLVYMAFGVEAAESLFFTGLWVLQLWLFVKETWEEYHEEVLLDPRIGFEWAKEPLDKRREGFKERMCSGSKRM